MSEKLKIDSSLKAITIHGPWAWAIVTGKKRVENRIWETPHRGTLVIHAGQSTESDKRAAASFKKVNITPPKEFERGALVGTVQLVDILPLNEYLEKYGDDPMNREFALGPFCWVLEDAQPCEPVPCPGNFQIWNVKNQLNRLKVNREKSKEKNKNEKNKKNRTSKK